MTTITTRPAALDRAGFLEEPATVPALPGQVTAHNPFPTSVRHRLDG